MRLLILSLLITISALFSGCGAAKVTPLKYKAEELQDKSWVSYGSYSEKNMDIVSPAGNMAILFKKGAEKLKEEGVEYFVLEDRHKVPPFITKFKDLINYCYPNNANATAEGWDNGSSSLENKCVFTTKFAKDKKNGVFVRFYQSKLNPTLPVWSIDNVINDPYLNGLIANAKTNMRKDNPDNSIIWKAQ